MARDPSLFLSPPDPPRPAPAPSAPPPAPELAVEGEGADPAPSPGTGPGGRGRGRLVAAAAVVAVAVAVLAGQVGGDGGAAEDASATPSTAVPRTSAAPSVAAPGRAPATEAPALALAGSLGPLLPEETGTTVALVTADRLVLAHLDTGTIHAVEVSSTEALWVSPPFQVLLPVGDDLLLAGDRPTLVPRQLGERPRPATGERAPAMAGLLPAAEPGRWWTFDHRFDAWLIEHGSEGPTGRRLSVPGDTGPVLPFGDGFLASLYGSIVHLDADGGRTEHVADGVAIAVDDKTLVRPRCDDALVCGLRLTDLAGGDERIVPPPEPGLRYTTHGGAELSPDGRWLAIRAYGEGVPDHLVLVEVATGAQRTIEPGQDVLGSGLPRSTAFTADSRWLLVADVGDGRLEALRLADGEVFEVDLQLEPVRGRGPGAMVALPAVPADADRG